MSNNPYRLARALLAINGAPLPIAYGNQTRVNATSGAASTAQAALPAGAKVILVRTTTDIALRFGNTGMAAAANDANAVLVPAGEVVMFVPLDGTGVAYDYFRLIQITAAGTVQIEGVDTQ